MTLQLGCSFATSPATPRHVVVAEQLGYERAWLYDSPALYPDVWMVLAECALATSTVRLGPGVLVPALRHPMVNASAIMHLCHLAPGRVQIAIGAGLTGQVTLGQRGLPWEYVRRYTVALRDLCAGEAVTWDGAAIKLIHPDGFAPAHGDGIEWFVGSAGPKGEAVARELADGALAKAPVHGVRHSLITITGTVRAHDEPFDAERIIDAAGHGAAMVLHNMVQRGRGNPADYPGGAEWLAAYEAIPPEERHLHLYESHLVGVGERDRPMLSAQFMRQFSGARTESEWHQLFDDLAAGGATGLAYQPAGADIEGELERFAEVFRRWSASSRLDT